MILYSYKSVIVGAKHELVNTLLIRNEELERIKGTTFTCVYPIFSVCGLENSSGKSIESRLASASRI